MKAKDLRERTTEHLQELEKTLSRDVFDAKFKNFTNRLNDVVGA
jgi:large subunit ribosomal protein L29